ncbi:uncharacterized protein LOC141853275 [Brevipalpus obovatus]|uniref:uncharacterized protein LOC141853275 n=1 Tax=Brevipalpus obovatus TaxID=246614 RepID=UPI003D9E943B
MDEDREIPGFFYDSQKRKYFRITPDHPLKHFRPNSSKKADKASSQISKKIVNICSTISNMQMNHSSAHSLQEDLLRSRLAQVTCIGTKKIELYNYRGVQIKRSNCEYLIGEPEHDSVYGVWTSKDPNDETGCVIQRFTFSSIPINFNDRELSDISYQGVNAFPPSNRVRDMSLIPIPERPFSALICLTNHCKKDQTTCSALGIYHLSNHDDHRNRLRGEDMNTNYEFWEPILSCTAHTLSTLAIGGFGHIRLFTPEANSTQNAHKILYLTKPQDTRLQATSLKFSPDGNRLYAGTNNGRIILFDVRQKSKICELNLKAKTVAYLHALQRNTNQLIVSCHDSKLCLVDTRKMTKGPVFDYPNHVNDCLKIPVSVDESVGVMCCSGQDYRIRFWSIQSGVQLSEWPVPTDEFKSHQREEYSLTHAWYSHSWNMLKGRPKPLVITCSQDKLSVNYHLDTVD